MSQSSLKRVLVSNGFVDGFLDGWDHNVAILFEASPGFQLEFNEFWDFVEAYEGRNPL